MSAAAPTHEDVRAALEASRAKADLERVAITTLSLRLAEYGWPAQGDSRMAVVRQLLPALLAHMQGDVSPVPDRHAFVERNGRVRISPALNSERIDNDTGVLLYINLRGVADSIAKNKA